MPDMKDAMRGAGFQGSRTQRNPPPGKSSGRGGRREGSDDPFPPGYPTYFGPDGHTRVDLLLQEAESLAACFERERLKRHQLRAFYDHAKRQLQRLQYGASFGAVHPEIAKLKAFAADRAGRAENPLPLSFKRFIDLNVGAVKDQNSFEKGFMPHFEAVVAYCARIA
jgi:CRISPR/Cas system CSM-associated protein Csm2 small subunit